MSFASDSKRELCIIENKRACCLKAECYGLQLFSKCFSIREAKMNCENGAVARRIAEAAAPGDVVKLLHGSGLLIGDQTGI